MGMDRENYDRYKAAYESYKKIYDLPLVKTDFFQDDHKAMDYSENRDFVVIVVPYGTPYRFEGRRIVVQNNLVSYTKMFSDLVGGSAVTNREFLGSAINLLEIRMDVKHLQEYTPIALIENCFTYGKKKRSHYGVVFAARIPDVSDIPKTNDIPLRSINETIYFVNPHNKMLYELAKEYIENYRVNDKITAEIDYFRERNSEQVKESKKKFLEDNEIDLRDYFEFKKRIVSEIEDNRPKSIMDVACGDDDIIYDFLKIGDDISVYANDIAIDILENYHFQRPEHIKIHFSNLDAVSLPFKSDSLDIMFCKNLLYRLDPEDRAELIKNCLRIAKCLIVVEILCYEEQNDSGKLLHDEFYKKELGENDGKGFMTEAQMRLLFSKGSYKTKAEVVDTNNGRYMYAWIRR